MSPAALHHRRVHVHALVVLFALSFAPAAWAQFDAPGTKGLVKTKLIADVESIEPGGSFTIGVHMTMKEHWHTYWVHPGFAGVATTVKASASADVRFGQVRWPLPTKFVLPGDLVNYGYANEVMLLVPAVAPKDVEPGQEVTITAAVEWLACHETCIPGAATLTLTLPVAAKAAPANEKLFDAWRRKLPAPADAKDSPIEKIEAAPVEHGRPVTITVRWKQEAANADWFPAATDAMAINKITVRHEGRTTIITYKPDIYAPDKAPKDGLIDSVIVFVEKGSKRGYTFKAPVAAKSQ